MVGEKFGNEYYRTENSAEKTLRKVRKELQDFMHSSSHYATLTTTQKVAQQREAERERLQAESEGAIYIASSLLTFEDREELYKNVYCGMPLKVGGLALFGSGGKLAMDLSQNEGLYEARSGIINFMRRQGYNTQHIDPAWTPHAVVFDYLDHIKSQPITRQLEVPDTFIARPPEVCADFDQ
jgi:hypothetical protein